MNALTSPPRYGGGPQDALELAALVRGTVAANIERRVLMLPLSRLTRADHPLVREAMAPLRRPNRARVFELPNGDVVAVSAPPGDHLTRAHDHLSTLFDAEAPDNKPLQLRLPQEAAALLAAIEHSLVPMPPPPPPPPPEDERWAEPAPQPDFTAAQLASLERSLASASIAVHLRRHVINRVEADGSGPQPLLEEIRLHLGDLIATLAPGAELASAPWLHRRLRRLLDRRLMAELARPDDLARALPPLLPLLPASLAEPEFLRLDARLAAAGRKRTTLVFTPADILADAEGFGFARDLAQARGYKLALDTAGVPDLALLPPLQLGFDYLLLRWSASLAAKPAEAVRALLPEDRGSIILAGVDRPAAIGWGWEEGITLFEGKLVTRGW